MQRLLGKLPERFQFTIHNLVGHPLMEVFNQLKLWDLANACHDKTIPTDEDEV